MKRIGPIILTLILVVSVGWGVAQPAAQAADEIDGVIVGSGAIEAETIIIASEIGGRISQVLVDEGAEVEAGQILLKLDESLLTAQQAELEAAIATALANLVAVEAGPRAEEIAAAEAALIQAKAQRDGAYQAWQRAMLMVKEPQPLLAPIRQAQAQVKQAEGAVELAQAEVKRADIQAEAASRNQSNHAALVSYDIALKQLEATRVGQKLAETMLSATKIQLAHLWEMYTNPIPFQAQANQARAIYRLGAAVTMSEANLMATRAQPQPEVIAIALAKVHQAESTLALFEAQQRQLTLTAPINGLITTRVADPGELAVPGATLLTLADLSQVTLTVFIPETQIGRVKVGQSAQVYIDSVDQVFEGQVTFIAPEAEFTPKNIQTQEERVNLVFAVEIGLANPDYILKPGMPADAEILP